VAFLRILSGLVVVIALIVAGVTVAARFSDGPLGMIAGGSLRSGELHSGAEPDWQFVRDVQTVEFQLLEPARSRTTWILEHDGRIFIPCGYMNTDWGRIWKQWPLEAEQNGGALLRVDGTLYPRQLVRIEQGPALEPLVRELNRKYGVGATVDAVTSGALWLFELAPRAA
jgi:hypothetical protein